MIILGIETSCDETAVSLISAGEKGSKALSNIVSSQVKLHSKWGGVVPNLAAREHLKNIIPVLKTAFAEAGKTPREIDLIAVTQGPGLIPALLIGADAARILSYVWKKPLLGIHHIEGHIYANFIHPVEYRKAVAASPLFHRVKFPILCLVVSGGHTQLVLMKKHLDYEIIGETLDDAAGEAFDKVARILGLGYPGGPAIAKMAMEFPISNPPAGRAGFQINSKFKINLPRPMINSNNLNFSFSGLKTAVLYAVKKFQGSTLKNKKVEPWRNYIAEMCYEFQQAVIDVLISKTLRAAKKYNPKTILLAGGVSANKELRKQMKKAIKINFPNTRYQIPDTKYSIDNAAMIAIAGYYQWKNMTADQKKKAMNNWKTLQADANLKLK